MKNLKSVVLPVAMILALVVSACGHKKIVVNAEDTKMTKNDLVSIDAEWVKEKGSHYDVQLKVKNVSENDIIILLNDMQCYKGTSQGVLKHTFFNTGERTIDFRKGQLKALRMVCTIGGKTTGDDRVVISRIFDNPGADGATRGKVLGENIEWKYISKN